MVSILNIISADLMNKVASFNGIEVFHIKSDKFKTNSINIFFHDNLSNENATKNALLPAVLKRGCEKFPNFQDISLYLESLYGAAFEYQINKKGERQIIQFYFDIVSDKFTLDKSNLFEKAFEFLFEIIAKPLIVDNAFKEEYVTQEKENLKKFIESRINDKIQYAVERCFEEMAKDEPYGIYEYGRISDLDSITPKNLYEHLNYFLETLPMSIFVSGSIDDALINEMIKKFSGINRKNIKNVGTDIIKKDVIQIKKVTEKMNVSQGKLCLGFRTNTTANENEYYALMVYNGILGGGIHSKLFQNVREKASLAYYAFSRLDKFKGLMLISCGIESENKEKAYKIILEQIEAMNKGDISDYEITSTLKTMETGIKSLRDSQLQIVDFNFGQTITGTNETFESIIEKIKNVSKQDIINISNRIILDTVYFLEPDAN
jgi:predicted Zn-dependent peptidase